MFLLIRLSSAIYLDITELGERRKFLFLQKTEVIRPFRLSFRKT